MIYQASKSSDFIDATKSAIKSPKLLNEYALRIPRAYARGESTKMVSRNDIPKIPCYILYLEPQIGRNYTRKPTYVYWELPKTKRLVAVILHPDGGVDFKKDEHKFIIRETDELDRRIILGFCRKYHYHLINACHDDSDSGEPRFELKLASELYKASSMPKRIKTGKSTDLTWFYKDILQPYEECGIFSNVKFMA